jgi:hypothetical protein
MGGMNTFNDNDTRGILDLLEGVGGEGIVGGRTRVSGIDLKHAYPPSGGIPAATWNATTEAMTPGQASCRVATKTAGVYEPTTDTVMVENPVGAIVGISGKPITIGKNTSGAWTVLVEDCSGTTDGDGPVADPDQDPIGGERDLGIKIEV